MDKKLFDLEAKLLEPAQMTSDDKYFQQAYRVYMNLIWLNGEVGPGAGDVAGGADFPPTDTSVNMMETIEKDLNAAQGRLRDADGTRRAGLQPRDRQRHHAADRRPEIMSVARDIIRSQGGPVHMRVVDDRAGDRSALLQP